MKLPPGQPHRAAALVLYGMAGGLALEMIGLVASAFAMLSGKALVRRLEALAATSVVVGLLCAAAVLFAGKLRKTAVQRSDVSEHHP